MTTPIDFAIPASKAVWLHEAEAVAERHRSALPWVRLYIFATSGYKQAHEDNQRAAFRFSCSGRERARMTDGKDRVAIAKALKIPLDRDVFTRTLIRELAGALEDVVGIEEASGYISIVGSAIGEQINEDYRRAYEVSSLSRGQVADVLVDLKRRIQGNFFIIEEDGDKIVLGNTACPFAEKVIGRRSMCMMTSNVFGHIAAENLGYGKVELQRTIAEGHSECRVVVYLRPTAEAENAEGREYQGSIDS